MIFVTSALKTAVSFGLVMGFVCQADAQTAPLPPTANQDIQIWFGPQTWDINPDTGAVEYSQHDFPALIAPGAPWKTARARLNVIDLAANVLSTYPNTSDLLNFMNSNPGLQLDLSAGVLFNGGQCGIGVEGMSTDPYFNSETVNIARYWKQAGGNIDYLVMDAPLYYGHAWVGGCNYAVDETANRAAATVNQVLQYFPNVKIVDAEGPAFESNADWFADMQQFIQTFNGSAGVPISAVTLDLHWKDLRAGETLADTVTSSLSFFHGIGLRVGLFIDADDVPATTASDSAWMQANRMHLSQIAKANYGLDYIAIEAWVGLPQYNLPATSSTGFTSLINNAYVQFIQ